MTPNVLLFDSNDKELVLYFRRVVFRIIANCYVTIPHVDTLFVQTMIASIETTLFKICLPQTACWCHELKYYAERIAKGGCPTY